MKLSEIKNILHKIDTVNFKLHSGVYVPHHFHVTEVGMVTKHFIDCGGKERIEKVANFQLWNADDEDHKLKPQKLLQIIALSEKILGEQNLEIEVEYQTETIGKYSLDFDGIDFLLVPKQTACLALDLCGLPSTVVSFIKKNTSAACTPGGTCC